MHNLIYVHFYFQIQNANDVLIAPLEKFRKEQIGAAKVSVAFPYASDILPVIKGGVISDGNVLKLEWPFRISYVFKMTSF